MQPKIDMKIIEQRDTGKSSAQLHLYYMPKRYKSKSLSVRQRTFGPLHLSKKQRM
ncbi:hypothetical protein PAHAL_4G138800 [Panicum hallii]|jgi:hypothetical protein|uniref:Uncharacterized protein n=1 Tax=Panicum hallii TaxID=206008 RepID=A0A2T8JCW6_9POAL|nr:hypothetical protein PAHAL_4G138800 [Panicum hallii]